MYDNTKIIIVSDHCVFRKTGNLPVLDESNEIFPSTESVNPVLMVKDFGKKGDLKIDSNFMTNADTAWLSCKDVIENPVNPFTGKLISENQKSDCIYVTNTDLWSPDKHPKNVFKLEQWYRIDGDIFDASKVTKVSEKEALEELK